jgi:hypothetical protein
MVIFESPFKNGYFETGVNNDFYYGEFKTINPNNGKEVSDTTLNNALKAAGEYTYEFAMEIDFTKSNSSFRFFTGAYYDLSKSGTSVLFKQSNNYSKGDTSYLFNDKDEGQPSATVDMGTVVGKPAIVASNFNTYTFTYEIDSDAKTVISEIFGNASKYFSETFTVLNIANNSKMQGYGGANAKIFAVRIYVKALTDAEIQQNHFADIATMNRLDLTSFLALENEADKLEVYAAFAEHSASEPMVLLQTLLENAVAAALAYN